MPTVLITGSARGIGAALVRAFLAEGARVVALDVDDEANRALVAGGRPGQQRRPAAGRVAVGDRGGRVGRGLRRHVRAAFLLSRAVAVGMRERGWGRIVNMASLAGRTARPTGAAYGSSKAALIALTRVFAAELAADGITVNAIAPAMTDTPMVRSVGPETLAELTAQVPLGRIAAPEEIARLAVFLVAEAPFVTAATYDIDGGALMR